MVPCLGEDDGGEAFLDDDGAGAVFGPVMMGAAALALGPQSRSQGGRPAQDRHVGEMEHVVESVVIVVGAVVVDRVAERLVVIVEDVHHNGGNVLAMPLDGGLGKLQRELPWQAFLRRPAGVVAGVQDRVRGPEGVLGLGEVLSGQLR